MIKLTYKDLADLSRGDKRVQAIDKATFLQNFPVPGLVGGKFFIARVTRVQASRGVKRLGDLSGIRNKSDISGPFSHGQVLGKVQCGV